MMRFFDGWDQLACFLGVSERTLYGWRTGEARPSAAAFRLIRILEDLEGTDIHSAFVAQAKRDAKERHR